MNFYDIYCPEIPHEFNSKTYKYIFRFVASTNKTQNPKENKCFSATKITRKCCPEKRKKKISQFCEICVHICKTHLNDSLPRK